MDTTSSCLVSWFSDALIRENEALTRALQMSISGTNTITIATTTTPSSSCTSNTSANLSQLILPDPAVITGSGGRSIILTAAGRVGKKKSRASKRNPTTYISTDLTNFRLMVQQITGIQTCCTGGDQDVAPEMINMLQQQQQQQSCAVLPTFDASVQPLMYRSVGGGASSGAAELVEPVPIGFESALPCFPTLDSWSVLCEKKEIF